MEVVSNRRREPLWEIDEQRCLFCAIWRAAYTETESDQRERHKATKTDRNTDRNTNRNTDRNTDRNTERKTERDKESQIERQIERQRKTEGDR